MPESKKLYNTPTSPDNAFSVFWEPDKENAKLLKKQTSLNKKCTIFSKDSITLWQGGRGWSAFGERNKIPSSFVIKENRQFVVVKGLTNTQKIQIVNAAI